MALCGTVRGGKSRLRVPLLHLVPKNLGFLSSRTPLSLVIPLHHLGKGLPTESEAWDYRKSENRGEERAVQRQNLLARA